MSDKVGYTVRFVCVLDVFSCKLDSRSDDSVQRGQRCVCGCVWVCVGTKSGSKGDLTCRICEFKRTAVSTPCAFKERGGGGEREGDGGEKEVLQLQRSARIERYSDV